MYWISRTIFSAPVVNASRAESFYNPSRAVSRKENFFGPIFKGFYALFCCVELAPKVCTEFSDTFCIAYSSYTDYLACLLLSSCGLFYTYHVVSQPMTGSYVHLSKIALNYLLNGRSFTIGLKFKFYSLKRRLINYILCLLVAWSKKGLC